jgi:AcrR family transcriptional regulator
MDRRSVKTKKLLENALIKLMIEKGFDKITIKDITEEADINRGTFYLHYKDKYDFLEQKEDNILKEFIEIVDNIAKKYHGSLILPSNKDDLLPIFTQVYIYIKDNADFMKVVLGPNGDLNFQMRLRNFIEASLVQNISIKNESGKMPVKYIATIASSAQLGIIQKWLKNGMEETPQELATFMSEVVFSIYSGVVKDRN